jgi:hypothetical protein
MYKIIILATTTTTKKTKYKLKYYHMNILDKHKK